MKKLLVVAALTMAAAPAMASKARMTALGNSAHLIDTTTIFVNSADVHYLGDFATIEFGTADNAAGTPHAEGGFVRSSAMGKWGAHLGRQSATVNEFVDSVNAGAGPDLLKEQNALDLIYGTELGGQKWGFGLHYSNAKDEKNALATNGKRKVSTLGASVGVRNDIWNAYLRFGLTGKTESDLAAAPNKLEQKGLYDLGGGYWIDTLYVDAKFLTTKGNFTSTGVNTDIEKTTYSVGVTDNVKVDGGNFFYGARFANEELKTSPGNKATAMGLPVLAGIEVDATSWMVLRGSITQTVLLGETKVDSTPEVKTSLLNDTTVAAGAGLKFGKLTFDGTLEGSTTGKVNADTLLANASVTYLF